MPTLREEIIDIVYELVPLNTTCPECEREIDRACLLSTPEGGCLESDKDRWRIMADKIVALFNIHYMNKLQRFMEDD